MSRLSYDPTHCTLCPRRCGGDRTKAAGRCRMPSEPVVAVTSTGFPLSLVPWSRKVNPDQLP